MSSVRVIEVKKSITEGNDREAAFLRNELAGKGQFLLNLMSSPGGGKTTALMGTIERLKDEISIGVMEADIDSDVDAVAVSASGVPTVQLHTGGMCHLDCGMTREGLRELESEADGDIDLAVLENVGNLVCPAEFDTGATKNVMILSVPEGDDKPLKYPLMFSVCDVVLISKMDVAEYFDFDLDRCKANILSRNPDALIIPISAKTGEGMEEWCEWLKNAVSEVREAAKAKKEAGLSDDVLSFEGFDNTSITGKWYDNAVIYQIYPLGMCGAPYDNDGVEEHRILKVKNFIPHMKKLGINTVLFNPLFESDTHGYNTRDYRRCDVRLGTNDDLKEVFEAIHAAGMRVVLDGVFNHVGRGFFAFKDVVEKREGSQYRDWFHIDFGGNSAYNDGLWYEGWEGNYDLVKLNLDNPAVCDYLMESVKFWIDELQIDGLRLDVAYMVNRNFLKRLRYDTTQWKSDFFLFGEILGGDYNTIMNDEMCHSATNYECYKGIFSSINSNNLFEIVHSLLRQFGKEPWCLYTGKNLVSFVDNHDVTRIASNLNNDLKIPLAYALCFTMPGIPAVYYGSEWGIRGNKSEGDPVLRPAIEMPDWNWLSDEVAALARVRRSESALCCGDFNSIVLENKHCLYERRCGDERILVAINIEDAPYVFHADFGAGRAKELLSGKDVDFGGGLEVPANTAFVMKPF